MAIDVNLDYQPGIGRAEIVGIGRLLWHVGSGEVIEIDVWEPANRRKGHATRMWQAANSAVAAADRPELRHSDERSEDGDAWAKSVGGKF